MKNIDKDWQGRIKSIPFLSELKEDGWYYTNSGIRFHAESNGKIFTKIWDIEKYENINNS